MGFNSAFKELIVIQLSIHHVHNIATMYYHCLTVCHNLTVLHLHVIFF